MDCTELCWSATARDGVTRAPGVTGVTQVTGVSKHEKKEKEEMSPLRDEQGKIGLLS